MMNRRDTAQELDRPHYYSQFWIDVAQGKRDLAAIRTVESDVEGDELEDDDFGLEAEPIAKAPVKPKPAKAPEKKPEQARPVISSLADLANIDLLMKSSAEMDGDEVPDIETGTIDDFGPFGQAASDTSPAIVTDFDVNDLDDEVEEPQALADDNLEDEFDEDEEEDEWGSSRKPSKPAKPRRQPRERRGF